ncbi:MAG: hypothetical protein KGH79_03325 [Patescibacteria group bacterium]|nr:hypothetical protein [Patescibacteria group bacterium]
MWQHWTNTVLGLVLIVMAFFGAVDTTYAWAFGILGTVIAIVGLWGATELSEGTVRHA